MKKLLLLFSFVLILISYSANAQNWTGLNGPFGTQVNDIQVHTSGAIIVATNTGIYRSTDEGITWTFINASTATFYYYLDMDSAGKLYATSNFQNNLYTSTDGGLTWSTISASGLPFASLIKIAPNGNIYAVYPSSTGNFLFRSTDGGVTFTTIGTAFTSQVKDLDIAPNGNIFVSTVGQGVQISTNGGANFSGSTNGLSPTASVYSLSVNSTGTFLYALATDGPYRSADGLTWVAIKTSIPDSNFSGQIELDAAGNLYVNNINSSKIYVSANPTIASASSVTWSAGVSVGSTYQSSCSYFKDSNKWLVGNQLGINKTVNAGGAWAFSNQGIFVAQSDVAIYNGTLFIANSSNGYYFSSDDGATWTFKGLATSTAYNFIILNDNSIITYGSGIYKSADGGATWIAQNAAGFYSPNTIITNGINLCTLSGNTLSTSTTQGISFTTQTITGLPASYFLSAFQTDGTNFYALTNNGGTIELYKITGTTATNITTNTGSTSLRSLQFANSKLYTLTTNTLLSSADGGATWTSASMPITNATNVWATNNNVLFVQNNATTGSAVTLLRSSDGGNTWVSSPLVDGAGRVTKAIVAPNSYAYLAVNRSKVHKSKSIVIRPSAPMGLSVIGKTTSIVDMIMNDPITNNEKWVRVERSTGNNTTYDSIGTVAIGGGSYGLTGGPFTAGQVQGRIPIQDFGAVKNTTYFYRIAFGNAAGLSAYSNEISVTTLDACTSSLPDNKSWTATVNVTAGSNAGSTFTNAAARITSIAGNPNNYTLYNYTFGSVPSSIYPTSTNQTLNFIENCGETYFGYTGNDIGNSNGTWNATTKTLTLKWQTDPTNSYPLFQATTTLVLNATDPIPSAPTGLKGFVYSGTGASLNWIAAGFETSYVVERSTTSGSGFTTVGTINYPTTNFIDKALTTGTTYYYRVKAQNATGVSPASVQLSITPSATLFTPVDGTSDINVSFDQQQGAAWGDLDGDGYDDLIMPSFNNAAGQAVLPSFYQNNGGTGQFTKKTISALAGEDVGSLITRGIQLGDIDNDGDLDLFLARTSNAADLILVNNGNWNFSKLVITATKDNSTVWKTASFVDFDRDGKLDVFVGFDNSGGTAAPPVLLKNNGSNAFVPVTSGPLVTTGTQARAHGWADYDNDGDLDVLVFNSNSTPGNRLFKNNGDGTFTLVTGLIFDTDNFANARTCSWGDIDNDGDLDLYIGSQTTGVVDRLYLNSGAPSFTFTSVTSAVAESGTGTYGSAFGDLDNDGDLDLIAVNQSGGGTAIFLNGGAGNFTKSTIQEFLTDTNNGAIGGALGDFDNNGFLDFYAGRSVNTVSPNFLLKNTKTLTASTNWLRIKLVGTNSNKAAIGARIIVTTASPSRTQIREVASHTGYGSMSSQVQHFGLGTATSVSQIVVRWPSGKTQTFSTATAVNQTVTITEDTDGPLFKTLTPANSDTNASTAAALKVEMSEASTPVAGKKITLYLASNLTTAIASIDVTSGTKVGEVYTFTLPAKLTVGAAYVASVDAGAFVDAFGNSSLALPTTSWAFTTGTGPTIATLSPTNNTTGVNANSTIDITFSGPVTAVSGKTINIFKGTSTTASYTLQATAGTITGNKVSFSLTPKLQNGTSYSVAIDAGAFLDNSQNDFVGLAAANWSFSTSAGPDVDVLLPSPASTGIAINSNLEITFKQSVTAASGKKIQVKDGTTTIIDIDVSTKGTITGNKYVYTPTTALPYLKQLEVTIQAGAFIDANQNEYKGTTTGQWTFTTVEAPDVTPPTIAAFTPPASIAKNFSNQSLSLTVTDNKAVATVTMSYRKVSATTINTLAGVAGTNNSYSFALQNTFVDDMGFEYYFEAVDAAGNKSRSPAAANSFHFTRTAFNNTNIGIPVSAGGTVNDYQIVSVPFDLPSKQVQFVFQDLGQPDKTKWRLLRYQNSPAAWIDYPASDFTNVSQGEGYFVNSRTGANVTLGDKTTPTNSVIIAPNNTQNSLFTLSLKKGWNLIGNPYSLPIIWNDSRVAGVGALKIYQNGTYADAPNNGQLDRLKGGFVLAEADTQVPVKLNVSAQGGRQQWNLPAGDINSGSWILRLQLEQNGLVTTLGGIGMHPNARKEKDDFDDLNPPRIGDYIEMHFPHPEYFLKSFSRDVVPTTDHFSWDFTVETSSAGETKLRWNSSFISNRGKKLFLLDKNRQQLINMSLVSSYSFYPRESSGFTVFFGTDLKDSLLPSTISLSNPYPNPSKKDIQLSFALPDGSPAYDVNLRVFDLQGRLISSLVQGSFQPGFYESTWSAPETSSATQVYICKLEVNATGRSQIISKRIIIQE